MRGRPEPLLTIKAWGRVVRVCQGVGLSVNDNSNLIFLYLEWEGEKHEHADGVGDVKLREQLKERLAFCWSTELDQERQTLLEHLYDSKGPGGSRGRDGHSEFSSSCPRDGATLLRKRGLFTEIINDPCPCLRTLGEQSARDCSHVYIVSIFKYQKNTDIISSKEIPNRWFGRKDATTSS